MYNYSYLLAFLIPFHFSSDLPSFEKEIKDVFSMFCTTPSQVGGCIPGSRWRVGLKWLL